MRYNTNNPVGPDGSNDPRDLNDNAGVIDLVTNSLDEVVNDRLGRPRNTVQAFHNLVIDSKAQVAPTVAAAKAAVNSTADAAIEEMQETAANLGDDLNNKRYGTYVAMLADPQTRDAVVGIVDGDPDPNLNGWYSWSMEQGMWLRFSDQPVSSSSAQRLFDALDPNALPDIAWSVGDEHGAAPLRIRESGVTEADALSTEQLTLQGLEALRSKGIAGVVLAILDALDNSPWLIRDDGTSVFAAVDAKELLLRGVDISGKLGSRVQDKVMTENGLVPVYPTMTKISGWGSSSLEFLSPFITQMFADIAPGASYFNGATGGETSRSLAARLGSVPMLVTIPGSTLPESGAVAVSSSNVVPNSFIRAFTGTLAGIAGTMSSSASTFTFTRSASGAATDVPADTPFIPDVGPAYRDGVGLLWMGKNDITTADTAQNIAQRIDASFDYFKAITPRMLVFGHFGNTNWLGGPTSVPKVLQLNALHKARYEDMYFDTLAYLESPRVWTDTGITPTADDLAAQAGHCLPQSLTTDGAHFSPALNAAFTQVVKEKLISLGWF
ncbi:hypothetical protein [Pseudomonas putida]|uniref:hypothetical protein n=1 Tax=Pseudomonas putida TaxID=303 RepID=UPI003F8B5863